MVQLTPSPPPPPLHMDQLEESAVRSEAEMFFLRQENRRRTELEQDLEEVSIRVCGRLGFV